MRDLEHARLRDFNILGAIHAGEFDQINLPKASHTARSGTGAPHRAYQNPAFRNNNAAEVHACRFGICLYFLRTIFCNHTAVKLCSLMHVREIHNSREATRTDCRHRLRQLLQNRDISLVRNDTIASISLLQVFVAGVNRMFG
jgi:hypothetical protein